MKTEEIVKEYVKGTKNICNEVYKFDKEKRAKYLILFIGVLQVQLDLLPDEWKDLWEITTKN